MGVYEQVRVKKDPDGSGNFVTSFTLDQTLADVTGGSYFIDCAGWDEMTISITYDPTNSTEALTSRVDFSFDQTDWHPEADEVVASGVATALPKTRLYTSTGATAEALPVISIPLNDRWARLMCKSSANTGTVKVNITMSKVGS